MPEETKGLDEWMEVKPPTADTGRTYDDYRPLNTQLTVMWSGLPMKDGVLSTFVSGDSKHRYIDGKMYPRTALDTNGDPQPGAVPLPAVAAEAHKVLNIYLWTTVIKPLEDFGRRMSFKVKIANIDIHSERSWGFYKLEGNRLPHIMNAILAMGLDSYLANPENGAEQASKYLLSPMKEAYDAGYFAFPVTLDDILQFSVNPRLVEAARNGFLATCRTGAKGEQFVAEGFPKWDTWKAVSPAAAKGILVEAEKAGKDIESIKPAFPTWWVSHTGVSLEKAAAEAAAIPGFEEPDLAPFPGDELPELKLPEGVTLDQAEESIKAYAIALGEPESDAFTVFAEKLVEIIQQRCSDFKKEEDVPLLAAAKIKATQGFIAAYWHVRRLKEGTEATPIGL